MLETLFMSAALALGQSGPGAPAPPDPGVEAVDLRRPFENALMQVQATEPAPDPENIVAPLIPVIPPKEGEPAPVVGVTPDRWFVMKSLQGTWLGSELDGHRMYFYGWTEMSYTASTASVNNQPVVWNDRANQFLLQQEWFRLGRSVVTSGTTEPTFGFQIDILTGSDYRFTLPRGLFYHQLSNSDPTTQNLYGVDPIQHYVSMYVPTLFQGTEFRFGRLYTPWGLESLEGVSNPVLSRSYAFNWSPPFTHFGLGAYTTFNKQWSAVAMLVNGNDVYIGDSSEEMRGVGNIRWAAPDGRNTVTVAASIGRGRFNENAPFAAATIGLANEPAGRNNFNAFDIVYQHFFNPVLSYQMEAIYGCQTNAPSVFAPGGFTWADWASACHYVFYNFSPRVGGVLRYENFLDSVGQRTGFPGLYTAITGGLQFKIRKDLWLRPELRYDYNSIARPFEGQHDIFTAASDLIIRW